MNIYMDDFEKRAALSFVPIVYECFEFLEAEYGFKCVETGLYEVVYRSLVSEIRIYHGKISYEIEFYIDIQQKECVHKYDLSVIFRHYAPDFRKGQQVWFQASTRHAVEYCVKTISELIRSQCQGLLKGEEATLKALADVKQNFWKIAPKMEIKHCASVAWKNRNFGEVVRLYEFLQTDLNETEIRKLEFARKKVGKFKDNS